MQRCWLVQIAERVPRRVEIALLAPSAPDPALCPRVSAPCPGACPTRTLIMNWMVVDGEHTTLPRWIPDHVVVAREQACVDRTTIFCLVALFSVDEQTFCLCIRRVGNIHPRRMTGKQNLLWRGRVKYRQQELYLCACHASLVLVWEPVREPVSASYHSSHRNTVTYTNRRVVSHLPSLDLSPIELLEIFTLSQCWSTIVKSSNR